MFTGTFTAIVTPFRGGAIDEDALERLIRMQIKGGVDGIVPVGTTGESPTVDCQEHIRIIELAVKFAAGKVKVIAGTGANATNEAIHLTQAAEKAGADGSLQVAPYYNKPPQEGLFQHFKAIARATQLPIVLYSVPSRCGVEISVETTKRLAADCKNIIGIKEAGGSCDRVSQLRAALGQHAECFGYFQRAVVRQHDAARADMQTRRGGRHRPNHHFRTRVRQARASHDARPASSADIRAARPSAPGRWCCATRRRRWIPPRSAIDPVRSASLISIQSGSANDHHRGSIAPDLIGKQRLSGGADIRHRPAGRRRDVLPARSPSN